MLPRSTVLLAVATMGLLQVVHATVAGSSVEDRDDDPPAAAASIVPVACDAAPQVKLRVACLDGSALDLTVPARELVREVMRSVGRVRCQHIFG